MDIVSHTLSGIAVGTLVAAFSKSGLKRNSIIVMAGGIGGALPDLDAISLWSGFDSTIGTFFRLEHTGEDIYFGKMWYSHHAALHSLMAPFVFIFLIALLNLIRGRMSGLKTSIFKNSAIVAFILGYFAHLFEDMITPASVWGGVNLFFPDSTYVGGFGKIWWWNNYDLVLIIASVIILNCCCILSFRKRRKVRAGAAALVSSLGLSLFLFQMSNRPVDFSYEGHTPDYEHFEAKSKEIQREILGERIFQFMTVLDESSPVYF